MMKINVVERIYLDWNATTPLSKESYIAMQNSLKQFGNPSSIHFEGRAARNALEKARDRISEIIGTSSRNKIIFTSGATEAAAMALHSRSFKCAPIEHDCVKVWADVSLPVSKSGMVKILNPESSCLQMANSETGIIQNVPNGILFSDTVQAFGKTFTNFSELSCECAVISAHKIGGPKGIGALIVKDSSMIEPIIRGGGQEGGIRSGTENLTSILGFAAAVECRSFELNSGEWDEIKKKRDYLESMIKESNNSTVIVGKKVNRLPNTSYFLTPGWQADLQVACMDLGGFSISSGMACSNGKVNKGDTLRAMGYSNELSDCGIRVSIGSTTSTEDLDKFIEFWSLHLEEWKKKAA